MKVLLLIPARGGSKGLPGKNLKPVGGIPLVGRSARLANQVARHYGAGSRVFCSTDDPAVAVAAREWGAETPFLRPAELASDSARSMDVVFHVLDRLGENFDAVVLLQPTSPLTEFDDILGALRLFADSGVSVISVCPDGHPPAWSYLRDEQGRIRPFRDRGLVHQRQQAEATVHPNGAIYVATPVWLRANNGFVGEGTRGFLMPPERSVDIDTAADLIQAEAFLAARPVKPVAIAGRLVGPGQPCFIIAEAGVNHNGSLDLALKLVDAAADAGADAVKFQTFTAEKVISSVAPKAEYQKVTTGADESQLAMVRRLELDVESHQAVVEHCRRRGILFLSSPFDRGSSDLLEKLGVTAFKVGSGELTHHQFLGDLAGRGKPMLVSTGMSNLVEINAALDHIRRHGDPPIALFHCVSAYPAPTADCNLRVIELMRAEFGVPVGWSDHTLGIAVALAAVARGADLVEKHLTLDHSLPGPDHRASLEPHQFKELVARAREIEESLGRAEKKAQPSEIDTTSVARRSLFAKKELAPGHGLESDDVIILRPGTGIPPQRLPEFIGRSITRTVPAGSMLNETDFE